MLIDNGSFVRASRLGGDLTGVVLAGDRDARLRTANAMQFGTRTSWPTGYQSVARARVPALATSGQMTARLRLDVDLTTTLRALGNMAALAAFDINMTASGNVLSNTAASFSIDVDLTPTLRATGYMSALFNIPSLPTANDIAQEVWSSFQIEAGLSGADVMRILLAVAAGKTNIAPGSPVVVTFRDQDDTKDRVRAEMVGSERDAVTVDGAA